MIDEDLIERAKNNDKYAFKLIFNTYRQKVFRTAYLIVKDFQRAEDIVQDAFLQVYLKIHNLKNVKAFEIWIYRITVNLCFSSMKKEEKVDIVPIDENSDSVTAYNGADLDIPDNIVIQRETQKSLMECIYSLPVKHRTVLTLYYFNDMNIKEIGDILNCSEGTVKSRLFYSKKMLKQILGKRMDNSKNNSMGGLAYEI